MSAEVVAPHVCGQQDRSLARLHLLKVLPAGELPVRNRPQLFEADVVGDRPGVVPENAIAAEEVGDGK